MSILTPFGPNDEDDFIEIEGELAAPIGIQRVAPRHAAKTLPGIIYAYALLGVFVLAAAFLLVKVSFTHVRVEKRTVTTVPKSAAGLVTALGTPAQTIAGEEINTNLKGAQCALYQPADGLVIICR